MTTAYDELDERGYMVEWLQRQLALKRLTSSRPNLPDLIVMDIQIAQDATEAAKVHPPRPRWSHLPIIALTGVRPENLAPQQTFHLTQPSLRLAQS